MFRKSSLLLIISFIFYSCTDTNKVSETIPTHNPQQIDSTIQKHIDESLFTLPDMLIGRINRCGNIAGFEDPE